MTEPPDRDTTPQNVPTAAAAAPEQPARTVGEHRERAKERFSTLSAEEFRKAWMQGQTLAALSLAQQEKDRDQER